MAFCDSCWQENHLTGAQQAHTRLPVSQAGVLSTDNQPTDHPPGFFEETGGVCAQASLDPYGSYFGQSFHMGMFSAEEHNVGPGMPALFPPMMYGQPPPMATGSFDVAPCSECVEMSADSYCTVCQRLFCEVCWQSTHSNDDLQNHLRMPMPTPVAARNATVNAYAYGPICAMCDSMLAESYCAMPSCGMAFCSGCWDHFHTDELKGHTALPIPSSETLPPGPLDSHQPPCSECGMAFAESYCASCDASLCGQCWDRIHATDKARSHTPLPVVRSMPASARNKAVCATCELASAEVYCPECDLYFCRSCRASDHSGGNLQSHTEIPLAAIASTCSDCMAHPATSYCVTCTKAACSGCGAAHTAEKHSLRSMPPGVGELPAGAALCGECESRPPDVDHFCEECGYEFCRSCWESIHNVGNLSSHTPTRAPTSSKQRVVRAKCDKCHSAPALSSCTECQCLYCAACWETCHCEDALSCHTAVPVDVDRDSDAASTSTEQDGPTSGRHLCIECKTCAATSFCGGCAIAFCSQCWRKIHSSGKLLCHIELTIPAGLPKHVALPSCDQCEQATAM